MPFSSSGPMTLIVCFLVLLLHSWSAFAASAPGRRSSSDCTPSQTRFSSPADVSTSSLFYSPRFVAVSHSSSFAVDHDGLQLYMDKPKSEVKTKGGINNIVAEGATVNSTFVLMYGRVTMEIEAPEVPGAVTAAILIAAKESHDEIDVELLGGDPTHWQTNVFTLSSKDKEPLYGVLGGSASFPQKAKISTVHNYTIDWNAERIVWSLDGKETRKLMKGDTHINGTNHYPVHPLRVQLGIWDASNPIGTSEWAHGPIDWKTAPSRMTATVKTVIVECPYN